MAEDTDMTDVGARDDNPSTLNLNGNDTMTDLEYPTYPSSSTVICNADDALIKKLETDMKAVLQKFLDGKPSADHAMKGATAWKKEASRFINYVEEMTGASPGEDTDEQHDQSETYPGLTSDLLGENDEVGEGETHNEFQENGYEGTDQESEEDGDDETDQVSQKEGDDEESDEESDDDGNATTTTTIAVPFQSKFDFSSVLPEAILTQLYPKAYESYDALWLSKYNIPDAKLDEFSKEWMCRHHMHDLFRFGALAAGDILGIKLVNEAGQVQWRYVQVLHVGIEEGNGKWYPCLAMLATNTSQAGPATVQCETPDQIISAVETNCTGLEAVGGGYGAVTVWRGNATLGSIADVRNVYALWQMMFDLWTEGKGLTWRKRSMDKRTQRLTLSAMKRKKGKKDESA